jgi:hypothetical protein
MKKILSILAFGILFCTQLNAQVSKSDIEKMMTDAGTTSASITSVYVGNTTTFYTDGSWKRTDATYKNPSGTGGENKFTLAESGVRIVFSKEGKIVSSILFPYANISSISVGATGITMYLRD